MEKLLLYRIQLSINNLKTELRGLLETVEDRYTSITPDSHGE